LTVKRFAAVAAACVCLSAFTAPAFARDHHKVHSPKPASHSSHSSSSSKVRSGTASWYQYGRRTANGERFNPDGLTAAHRTLPFGTRLVVRNRRNGRSVVVRVNDRGPFIRGRVLDVSRGAARKLGMIGTGTAPVDITVEKTETLASN